MQRLFGTDGIRGVAGEFPLDEGTVQVIGASLARRFSERIGREPRFITGRDTRESGRRIEQALHSGITAKGAKCESAGVITTPAVAFLTGKFEFDAGVVVSASHNPYRDNGIKIFLPNGRKLDESDERLIEQDIASNLVAPAHSAPSTIDQSRTEEFTSAYAGHFRALFPDLSLSGLRLAVDCANGAACFSAPAVLSSFGADVVTINAEPDGRNINENCGSLHLGSLQRAVAESTADMGVAFDGDADRALFVDEQGQVVDGDATLWILGRELHESGKLDGNVVVATVMSNIGLELAFASLGIKLVRTSVGDKYVLEELLSSSAAIGGEQSGHIIMPQNGLVGDGLMTTLMLLSVVAKKGRKLSQLVTGFERYPQTLVNVKVKEKRPFESVPAIIEKSAEIETALAGQGRLLLRYSGTENLARVMIEGRDQNEVVSLANGLADVIRQTLGE